MSLLSSTGRQPLGRKRKTPMATSGLVRVHVPGGEQISLSDPSEVGYAAGTAPAGTVTIAANQPAMAIDGTLAQVGTTLDTDHCAYAFFVRPGSGQLLACKEQDYQPIYTTIDIAPRYYVRGHEDLWLPPRTGSGDFSKRRTPDLFYRVNNVGKLIGVEIDGGVAVGASGQTITFGGDFLPAPGGVPGVYDVWAEPGGGLVTTFAEGSDPGSGGLRIATVTIAARVEPTPDPFMHPYLIPDLSGTLHSWPGTTNYRAAITWPGGVTLPQSDYHNSEMADPTFGNPNLFVPSPTNGVGAIFTGRQTYMDSDGGIGSIGLQIANNFSSFAHTFSATNFAFGQANTGFIPVFTDPLQSIWLIGIAGGVGKPAGGGIGNLGPKVSIYWPAGDWSMVRDRVYHVPTDLRERPGVVPWNPPATIHKPSFVLSAAAEAGTADPSWPYNALIHLNPSNPTIGGFQNLFYFYRIGPTVSVHLYDVVIPPPPTP